MAGWRTFQRGHASLPAAFPSPVSRTWKRPVAGLGALVSVALLALLFSSCVGREESSGVALEPVNLGSVAQASTSATGTGQTSLLDSALAKVQDAAQGLTASRSPTGLQTRPLSDDAIQEVQPKLGRAEARLIDIYRLISQGEHRQALAQADALVRDHPNFQLAHLVHGDLLSLQVRPVAQIGDVPDTKARAALDQLNVLREESRRRLRALTERPPEGSVPTQFLTLSSQSRHAIAVDASRSRLYLFENQTPATSNGALAGAPKLKLIGDYYLSFPKGALQPEESVLDAGNRELMEEAGVGAHQRLPPSERRRAEAGKNERARDKAFPRLSRPSRKPADWPARLPPGQQSACGQQGLSPA